MDLINLETRQFETVPVRQVLERVGGDFPALRHAVAVWEDNRLQAPLGLMSNVDPARLVVTFEGLIEQTSFLTRVRTVLRILREKLGYPVDLEFASDGQDFFLLQCRAQSFSPEAAPVPIPTDLPPDRVLFFADHFVSNGRVPEITHIVYVDPDRYHELGSIETLKDVGRAVSRLNKLLPKRQFALMGPGRWGSRGDVKLGVSVTYSDISNTSLLMEIAARRGSYVPEVSFGTHFFQDLVESDIKYLPLFPDQGEGRLNRMFLQSAPNILADVAPDFAHLQEAVRVIDVPRATGGQILRVLMNGDLDQAIGILGPPESAGRASIERRRPDSAADDHWRWRLRMTEQIAASLDPARFGVRGFYVFGSTKNATAGPASDIDLLVHFAGTDAQRVELLRWLEGWSLCLSEMNFLRTGHQTEGLLDVHLITDEDIARRSSWAVKIDAVTDAARSLSMGANAR
jgi:hypothetical protein